MSDNLIHLVDVNSIKKIRFLKITFFLLSIIEIYAEFIQNSLMQWCTKPLLLPVLILLYWFSSKKVSLIYISALIFNWLANIFFIPTEAKFMMLASFAFLIHRVLLIIKIFKDETYLGITPIVLGAIPFLFLFLSVIGMVYENITDGKFYLIILQSILMACLGGFSLGNYIIKNTIPSKMLLISSLFFGVNLFILGIKIYYIDLIFLKPMSMIFFILGHYLFYFFMILNEKR